MEELRDHPNPQNDVVASDDDEPPMLSSETLSALKEFLAQQNRSLVVEPDPDNVENGEEQEEFLAQQNRSLVVEPDPDNVENGEEQEEEVALVSEDWRLSQFWYDRETAETVAREVLTLCQLSDSRVACIACPTLYAYLKVFNFSAEYL
jgi:hypothetical protein